MITRAALEELFQLKVRDITNQIPEQGTLLEYAIKGMEFLNRVNEMSADDMAAHLIKIPLTELALHVAELDALVQLSTDLVTTVGKITSHRVQLEIQDEILTTARGLANAKHTS